jgi:hypothetical protein
VQQLERAAPEDAITVMRRSGATAPALVYLVAHAGLGAAKVGVSEADGTRIAQHRRQGWQLIAAFQVSATAAAAIERGILRWWRADLALPAFLGRGQMPQGGWTETVALGRIDLARTVARVCEQATPA